MANASLSYFCDFTLYFYAEFIILLRKNLCGMCVFL